MLQIKGIITIDGVESEFVFDSGNGSWMQWGADRERLGASVEYLDAMEAGLKDGSDYFQQDEEDED